MQIALFGGAFDPPHKGHHQVTRTLLDRKIVDEVRYVPVHQHPFGKKITANAHRLAMLQLIIDADPRIKIENYELSKAGPSYTIDTLRHFHSTQPEHTWSFVIGSDNLPQFNLWDDYLEIVRDYTVYVYPREGSPFEPLLPGMVPLTDFPTVTACSTQIRAWLAAGEPIAGLADQVDQPVLEYIQLHRLYT